LQIAVCVLLKHTQGNDNSDLLVESECSDFVFSTTFNFRTYCTDVSTLFKQMESFYGDLEQNDLVEALSCDLKSFTKDLVETDSVGRLVYRKIRIFGLIQKHSFEKCKDSLNLFFRNVESLVRMQCKFQTVLLV
jgi:hypothetical protein